MNSPAPLVDLVAPDWASALGPMQPTVTELGDFLRAENAAGHRYLPAGPNVLRAFTRPLADVQGADRRPGPVPDARPCGRPVVLRRSARSGRCREACSTSTASSRRPRRDPARARRPLRVGGSGRSAAQPRTHRAAGRTRVAPRQGLGAGDRSRHRRPGRRGRPWSRSSGVATRKSSSRRSGDIPVIASPHPSPLSASRGFFGSRPFSRANELLEKQGAAPVDWALPPGDASQPEASS